MNYQKYLKILKYFALSLLALILVVVIAGVTLAYVYEDEVEQLVITELNKKLLTEITVEDVSFSVLKKFPYASLDFKNILIKSSKGIIKTDFVINSDTLCYANHLFLEFNIKDIFNNKYKIKNVSIENGLVNVLIDSKGNENYLFLKSDSTSTESSTFNLKKIKFYEVSLRHINKLNNIKYSTFVENAIFSGNFSEKQYEMELEITANRNTLSVGNVSYCKNISLVSTVSLNVSDSIYSINNGIFNINDVNFALDGSLTYSEPSTLNLKVSGKDIDINSFLALLPKDVTQKFSEYSSEGQFFIDCKINGALTKEKMPHIEASFGIKNAEITDEKNDLNFKNVNLNGLYSNGKKNNQESTFLKISNISATFNRSNLSGNYTIENFLTPKVLIQLKTKGFLEDLNQILKLDTLETFTGKVEAELKFQGFQKSLDKYTENDYKYSQIKGSIKVNDANIKIINDIREYKNISGDLTIDNSDLVSDSLYFKLGKSDFLLTQAWLQNIVPYILFKNKTLVLDAIVNSQKIDLDELLADSGDDSENSDVFFDDILINLQLNAKAVKYEKLFPTNLKCTVGFVKNKIIANNLQFNAMEGSFTGDVIFSKLQEAKYLLKCQANLKSVNITKLFTAFDNFDQTFILDKHLKGDISARVNFSGEVDKNYTFILPSIKAESTVEIVNGELNNFEPMQNLSSYVELSELKNIKFSKLNNDIYIKDQTVTIPSMNITNSAMSLEISGTHNFNNEFDYRVKVLMSDVLSKKFKMKKKQSEEFGAIEDDGLGKTRIFLKIFGNPDNYKVIYDAKKVKEQLKENLKQEKSTLKQILNEEFGWFKKDSAVIKEKQKEPENIFDRKYNIIWDEENAEKQ